MNRSNFIHLSRWFSALIVVISHVRSFIFKDFQDLSYPPGMVVKLFYFLTGFGHQAVMAFFVLSGYLIGSSLVKQYQANQFRFSAYLIARVSRIYIVLIAALLLTVLLDAFGIQFDTLGIYRHKLAITTMNFSVADRLSVAHFLSSLFMLQNIVLPPLGSNGPLWSLNYEFWYYVLFPCLFIPFLAAAKGGRRRPSPLYLGAAALLVFCLPRPLLVSFLIWLLGLLPLVLALHLRVVKYAVGLSLLAFLAATRFKLTFSSDYLNDFTIALLFALLLCCFQETRQESRWYRLNQTLASFSYTLYLIHFPLALSLLVLTHYYFRVGLLMEPSALAYGLFGGALLVVYLVSYALAYGTEFKTYRFKQALEGLTRKPLAAPA